jgi:hypothetical protein
MNRHESRSKLKYVKKFYRRAPTAPTPAYTTTPRAPFAILDTPSTQTFNRTSTAKMDALGGGLANVDLSKLSDRDKQELQQFAMNEGQKARIQSCMSRHCINPSLRPSANASDSNTLPHRYLFPQMHTRRQRQERQAGQVRGALYEELCGSVLGCQSGGVEGVGEVEAIEANCCTIMTFYRMG